MSQPTEQDPLNKLDQLTCLMLGRAAHLEDMVDVAELQAVELRADIARFAAKYDLDLA